MQPFTRRPSRSTVHAPHSPRLQPFFAPVRSRRSRNTSSNETRTSTPASSRSIPFTRNRRSSRWANASGIETDIVTRAVRAYAPGCSRSSARPPDSWEARRAGPDSAAATPANRSRPSARKSPRWSQASRPCTHRFRHHLHVGKPLLLAVNRAQVLALCELTPGVQMDEHQQGGLGSASAGSPGDPPQEPSSPARLHPRRHRIR